MNLSDQLTRHAEAYKLAGNMTQRDRALREREMLTLLWAATKHDDKPQDGKKVRMAQTLAQLLSVPMNFLEVRRTLLNHLPATEPLWARIDGEEALSVWTAYTLFGKARKAAGGGKARRGHGEALAAAIQAELADYDALPARNASTTKQGRVFKKFRNVKSTIETAPLPTQTSRVFWRQWRLQAATFLRGQLRVMGADPVVATEFVHSFERSAAAFVDEYTCKLSKIRAGSRPEPPSRRKEVEACRVLKLQPPPVGKKGDLSLATKQKRALARLYHPDAHGGSETLRPHYEAVLAAYDVLETCWRQ